MTGEDFNRMLEKYKKDMMKYEGISKKSVDVPKIPEAEPPAAIMTMVAMPSVEPDEDIGRNTVGYYTGYSAYSGFTPDRIPADKLTKLNYAFAKIDDDLTVQMSDPNIDERNFAALKEIKQQNPNLETLISIGGWDYSKLFSNAALTPASREKFAQSALDFILKHDFDGVDIDWEYPVAGGVGGIIQRPEDKQNFTLLLKAIRQKLNAQSQQDGKKYYLTVAGAPALSYLNNIEPAKVAELVDYFFIMAYDLHGPWDKYSDFNAPLFNPSGPSPQYKASVNEGVLAYFDKGVPASKLVLGMPEYGYIYDVTSNKNNGLYSPFTSAKSISFDNIIRNYLGKPGYEDFFEVEAKVPFISGNGKFITFDDKRSIKDKTQYALDNNLNGVGFWELAQNRGAELVDAAFETIQENT